MYLYITVLAYETFVKDEERAMTSSYETKILDTTADNPLATVSDVTLTPEVAEDQLPLQQKLLPVDEKSSEDAGKETSGPVSTPTSGKVGNLTLPSASTVEKLAASPGAQEPQTEMEIEASSTVYIDIVGSCFPRRQKSSKKASPKGEKLDVKDAGKEQEIRLDKAAHETPDMGSRNMEKFQEKIRETSSEKSQVEAEKVRHITTVYTVYCLSDI